jgi:hypothetical protein
MIAAIERLFGLIALSARPARVAEATAEIMVAVPAAGRRVPLSRGPVSNWLSQGRGAEDQYEHSK